MVKSIINNIVYNIMNTLDIVLINVISYLGGVLTSIGLFVKYKHSILVKTNSYHELQELVNNLTKDLNHASVCPPTPIISSVPAEVIQSPNFIASAPPKSDLKEIVIRT